MNWSTKEKFGIAAKEPLPGLFSAALNVVRHQKSLGEQLIDWRPKKEIHDEPRCRPAALSPVDLFLKDLAENVERIDSIQHVPHSLRPRLADLFCNLRKMNIHTFQLFFRRSPKKIRIKDCSWLTEEQFSSTIKDLDAKRLMVLQLEQCRRFAPEIQIRKNLAWFSNSLPNLGVLSLKGACRLSDSGLNALVIAAPALQSVNLSQCDLLTDIGIHTLAKFLGPILRELYIDHCLEIDATNMLPALMKFKYLEVLSVAGIETVSDQFVNDLLIECGRNIKKLDFADCRNLTNSALKVIGDNCNGLLSLNISNLNKLTDLGLEYLADGCRCIQTLILRRNKFSDEAIAAFLEASGEPLKEFSLNSVVLAGSCTAFSLSDRSRELLSLDLSFCPEITDNALGLIVDRCLSLRLLNLWGCAQITEVFLNGHSNQQVHIVGLPLMLLQEVPSPIEPSDSLLRYSSLDFVSDILETESSSSS